LTPHLPRRILALLKEPLAVVTEYRRQAADCRTHAQAEIDARMRSLLVSMALISTKPAQEAERIERSRENERT
jgi:hypothetical protein